MARKTERPSGRVRGARTWARAAAPLLADLAHDGTPYSKLDRIVEGLFLGPSHYSIGLAIHAFSIATEQ